MPAWRAALVMSAELTYKCMKWLFMYLCLAIICREGDIGSLSRLTVAGLSLNILTPGAVPQPQLALMDDAQRWQHDPQMLALISLFIAA